MEALWNEDLGTRRASAWKASGTRECEAGWKGIASGISFWFHSQSEHHLYVIEFLKTTILQRATLQDVLVCRGRRDAS